MYGGSSSPIIASFDMALPPELHVQFASHLPCANLRPYSLVSRAVNRCVNRFLWRCVDHRKLGGIDAFAQALKRDPARASFIRHLTFATKTTSRDPESIFSIPTTDDFWKSLEDAFRFITHLKSLRLLVEITDGSPTKKYPAYPDRFINIISGTFATHPIVTLRAQLPFSQLSQLCQTWPSLAALSVEGVPSDPLGDIAPGALPQLRRVCVESDVNLLCRIVPGRPVETIWHVGLFCEIGDVGDGDDFERLAATIRGCETLQAVQIGCISGGEEDSAQILPALANDNLRKIYLRIGLDEEAVYNMDSGEVKLTPELVLQALPSGALEQFPKLEILQIFFCTPDFDIDEVTGDPDGEVWKDIGEALIDHLASRAPATLQRVEIGCCWELYENNVEGTCIIARRGPGWQIQFAKCDSSLLPRFDDAS